MSRSHAKLEKFLDWLLAIYKIVFPFVVSPTSNLGGPAFSFTFLQRAN